MKIQSLNACGERNPMLSSNAEDGITPLSRWVVDFGRLILWKKKKKRRDRRLIDSVGSIVESPNGVVLDGKVARGVGLSK